MPHDNWPALAFGSWAPTKRSLHLYAQMLGKLRLALSPYQPNFLFTGLALTPRGFTTGVVPAGVRTVEVRIDVFSVELIVESSDGRERRISLAAPCTVARVYRDFLAALAALGVTPILSPIPQEVADRTPLDRDERPAIFDAAQAQRWLAVVTATGTVFDTWRAHFFGRVGIQLWWGAFDFAIVLFNGKKVAAPADRGYLIKYDLDAEMMNVGFYPGDDANPANFYGYIYPQPASCSTVPIEAEGATWSDALGEWILPYDVMRAAPDPERTLSSFLDAVYDRALSAGWDRTSLTYVPPPLRHAP